MRKENTEAYVKAIENLDLVIEELIKVKHFDGYFNSSEWLFDKEFRNSVDYLSFKKKYGKEPQNVIFYLNFLVAKKHNCYLKINRFNNL